MYSTLAAILIAGPSTNGTMLDYTPAMYAPISNTDVYQKTWAMSLGTETAITTELRPQWSRYLKPSETSHTIVSGYAPHSEPSLKEQLEQFQLRTSAEIRELANKVDVLARAVEGNRASNDFLSEQIGAISSLTEASLISAAKDGSLADLLDQIGDGVPDAPSNAVDVAVESLKSDRPEIRAAAGRALRALNLERARELLPHAIEGEGNIFVKAILKGALGSAL